MKFIHNACNNRSKTHASRDGETLLCTGDKPAHPLGWEAKPDYPWDTMKEFLAGNSGWSCKKCIRVLQNLNEQPTGLIE